MKNSHAAALSALLAGGLVAGAAHADKPLGTWYAGGSLGQGGYKTGYQRTADTIFSTGATSVTITPDVNRQTMWKVYGGYQWLQQVSIEGAYYDFGKPSYTANVLAPVNTTFTRNFSARGVGVSLVGWLPLTSTVSAFGKIGSVYTYSQASAASPGAGLGTLPAQTSHKLNPLIGLGAQYSVNEHFSGRLEYEAVHQVGDQAQFGAANLNMWSLGLDYRY
jgi:OOP family OmpA-OmpF porin